MTTPFLIRKNLNDQLADGPMEKVIEALMQRLYHLKEISQVDIDKRDIQEHLHRLTLISGNLSSLKRTFATVETVLTVQSNIRAGLIDFIHTLPDEYFKVEVPFVVKPGVFRPDIPTDEVMPIDFSEIEKDRCKYCMNEEDGLCDISATRRLRLYCDYYIPRNVFNESVKKLHNDGFLQIMAPHGFGKHSLLIRLDSYVRMQKNDSVFFDFFKYEITTTDTKIFFKSLCHTIMNKINPDGVDEDVLNKIWDGYGGIDYKLDEFIEKCVSDYQNKKLYFFFRGLAVLNEEISVILFNSLFRWNEKRKSKAKWQNVCVTVAYSPDFWYKIEKKYKGGVLINKDGQFHLESIKYRNQPVVLHGFSTRELFELASDKYQLNENDWKPEKILTIAKYLGNNPSLLNYAFYTIKKENLSPNKFYKSAPKANGIYKSFFDKLTAEIDQNALNDHLRRVVSNKKVEDDKYVCFWSLGILNKEEKKYTLSEFYKLYFVNNLNDNVFSLIKAPLIGLMLWLSTSMLANYIIKDDSIIKAAYLKFAFVLSFAVFVVPFSGNLVKSIKQAFYGKDAY